MPAPIVVLSDPNDFASGFFVDWAEHPDQGALTPIVQYDVMSNRYDFGDQRITIDIKGPAVFFSVCNFNFLNANFVEGDSVLLGDNEASKMPVHLLFDPPLRGVGAHVSAVGPAGRDYLGQMWVRLDGTGAWEPLARTGRLNKQRQGDAPFLGAKGRAGNLITEAWFDVVDPNNKINFSQVAINNLHFLPA